MTLPKSLGLVPQYYAPSSWWEHVPVAHAIVEYTKPDVIVELGSHYGVSFFSFCEAAREYSKDTYIYAVDSWEGDSQAGFYKNDVFEKVNNHRKQYHSQRAELLRCMFDEANSYFPDKSIDLLHIDGLHTYEAVKHDFELWQPKLKDEGTIIFHDWNVKRKDFGVWKLWEEIKNNQEYSCLQISYGYGLGIATKNKNTPHWHKALEECAEALRCKGRLLEKINQLRQENESQITQIEIREKNEKNLETIIKNNAKEMEGLKEMLARKSGQRIRRILKKIIEICRQYFY